ncbi:hypothetical protein [Pseudodesulfovibrio sediminis]|uniref:Lipoprotein n=1 Tax=Pseudodesulfovibrio sediminis TaxID=2810563 RepID=A0ABM7P3G1_9BACT|nr:hypothetical protein [Pseudodesulfovibrio sediminis]BCS87382.1 hypothetical protein PSDVSF_06240 [Pseudodesulfovibrio sediminis]
MRNFVLVLVTFALLIGAGCATKEEKAEQCFDSLKMFESGGLEPTKYNAERCLGDCIVALRADPNNAALAIAAGKIRLVYGAKDVACEDFAFAKMLGDDSAFLAYCNEDGSPK